MTQQRADILLAEQGIFHSRSAAQRAIMAGVGYDHNYSSDGQNGSKVSEEAKV